MNKLIPEADLLRPSSASRLNKTSPIKGFSPIRRSGSPVRRAQIHEIELEHARKLKRDRDEINAKLNIDHNKPKIVKFNRDVEYFENSTIPSPKLKINRSEIDGDSIMEEIRKIQKTQDEIMDKLNYILEKIDKGG